MGVSLEESRASLEAFLMFILSLGKFETRDAEGMVAIEMRISASTNFSTLFHRQLRIQSKR